MVPATPGPLADEPAPDVPERDPAVSQRLIAGWFVLAGALTLARWALDQSSLDLWDPRTGVDFASATVALAAGVATAVALILHSRSPVVARGTSVLRASGIAALVQAAGGALMDVFGAPWGVWGVALGGITMFICLVAAGIGVVSVPTPRRHVGVVYLAASWGALLSYGLLAMGASWLVLAVILARLARRPDAPGPA